MPFPPEGLKSFPRLPYLSCRRPAPIRNWRLEMANIARFNPFDDTIDDLFRGFFVRPISYEGANGAAQFRVDVSESDSAYTLRAEIPGVKKNDINVSIDGDTVAISAEVKNEKDVKNGERVLRTERYSGKVYRAFTLGQPVDEA